MTSPTALAREQPCFALQRLNLSLARSRHLRSSQLAAFPTRVAARRAAAAPRRARRRAAQSSAEAAEAAGSLAASCGLRAARGAPWAAAKRRVHLDLQRWRRRAEAVYCGPEVLRSLEARARARGSFRLVCASREACKRRGLGARGRLLSRAAQRERRGGAGSWPLLWAASGLADMAFALARARRAVPLSVAGGLVALVAEHSSSERQPARGEGARGEHLSLPWPRAQEEGGRKEEGEWRPLGAGGSPLREAALKVPRALSSLGRRRVAGSGAAWAAQELETPRFDGEWQVNLERSQQAEMVAIMSAIGVPSSLTKMGNLTPSRMTVHSSADNMRVDEQITQLGGLYTHDVQLWADGREFVGKHPLDGSAIRTRTRWERVRLSELGDPKFFRIPAGQSEVVALVSHVTHDKRPALRQRIVRLSEECGTVFHSVNTLTIEGEEKVVITAHRYLDLKKPKLARGAAAAAPAAAPAPAPALAPASAPASAPALAPAAR